MILIKYESRIPILKKLRFRNSKINERRKKKPACKEKNKITKLKTTKLTNTGISAC